MNAPDLAITDSGVRRIFRGGSSFLKRVIPYFLPMAPRKKTDTHEADFDRSVILWRSFITAVVLYFGSRDATNAPATPQLQHTMDRIEQHMDSLDKRIANDFEPRVSALETRLTKFMDGFRKGAEQQTGGR